MAMIKGKNVHMLIIFYSFFSIILFFFSSSFFYFFSHIKIPADARWPKGKNNKNMEEEGEEEELIVFTWTDS